MDKWTFRVPVALLWLLVLAQVGFVVWSVVDWYPHGLSVAVSGLVCGVYCLVAVYLARYDG